jgi:hypothetical protein
MGKQRNFRKTPDHIRDKIKKIKSPNVRVGCIARLSVADIAAGHYKHLNIGIKNGTPSFPSSVVPDGSAGRYSDANANGKEIIRTDLPMVTKTITIDSPNFGDWSKGSHDVEWRRDIYQRDFIPPTENEISIELVGEEGPPSDRNLVFRFMVDQPLEKHGKSFDDELFRLLNLLQESIGAADVFDTNATTEDYLRTVYVNWEILPPGERDANIARIVAGMQNGGGETRQRIADRYDFLDKMKPQAFIQGQGGFRRYFGAQFSDQLVAFENMEYGNAVYVMVNEWEQASRKTKQELLTSNKEGKDFFRVVHGKDWKTRVKEIIKKHRN